MSRRQKRHSSVSRSWYTVKSGSMCTMGHWIAAGEQALFVRAGWLKKIFCVGHAKQHYDLEPPPRPFVFRGEAPADFRDKRAGNGEDECD